MIHLWAIVALFWTGSVFAQEGPEGVPPEPEALRRLLIPPDLIMRHQTELQLTADQEQYIRAQVLEAQAKFTDLRWSLQRELDPLQEMIETPGTPEATIMAQLDKVLSLEGEMKRARLLMALRIKNKLNPEQIEKLKQFRRDSGGRMMRELENRNRRPGRN